VSTRYTRDDIARLAGVSPATVSRVYNKPGLVSEEKVRRVRAVARRIGYAPDKAASSLRRRGTGTILMLERRQGARRIDAYGRLFYWSYADALREVQSVVDASMYRLSLRYFSSVREIRTLGRRRVCDGVIGYSLGARVEAAALHGCGIPYVCGHFTDELTGFNRCCVDQRHGGRLAAAALRDSGHTKPAHITGELVRNAACRLRWEGFRDGFAGCRPRLIDGGLGIAGGHESARRLVRFVRSGRVDCVFVVNDVTAIGVLQAFNEASLAVPADVSVVGFDNSPVIATLPVKLATIDVVIGRAYATAANRLLEAMHDGRAIDERIEPVFVEGASIRART